MSLFGENDNAPPKKPKPKPRAENADAVQRLEMQYTDQFEARWGFKPRRNYGRERKELGELERQDGWGEMAIADLFPIYFSTPDTRITRGDYSLSDFVHNAQYLRQLARRIQLEPRTVQNIVAAQRAIGGRGK